MRNLLRRILHFLDTRFPEKVMVTADKYQVLVAANAAQADKIVEMQGRLGQLEAGVRAISMQMGFGGAIPRDFTLER